MDVLEQALELVEEIECHASDLDDYDVQHAADVVAMLASVDFEA